MHCISYSRTQRQRRHSPNNSASNFIRVGVIKRVNETGEKLFFSSKLFFFPFFLCGRPQAQCSARIADKFPMFAIPKKLNSPIFGPPIERYLPRSTSSSVRGTVTFRVAMHAQCGFSVVNISFMQSSRNGRI